jgi:fatty acid-binding protein DegV
MLLKEFAAKHSLRRQQLYFIETPYVDEGVKAALEQEAKALGYENMTWVRTGCVITCHGGPGAFGIVGTAG